MTTNDEAIEAAALRRAVDAFYTLTMNGPLDQMRAAIAAYLAAVRPFQSRVQPWMLACFGAEIAADRIERNHRFIEEALELVQVNGCTRDEAHQLVDYVYGRDQGDINQEVGGVMVTLAALCLANGLDMHAAGESELARVWGKIEQIRAKQAAKPKHSPLPAAPGHTDLMVAPETLDKFMEDNPLPPVSIPINGAPGVFNGPGGGGGTSTVSCPPDTVTCQAALTGAHNCVWPQCRCERANELLPCRCGSAPLLISAAMREEHDAIVECSVCKANVQCNTDAEAIAAWNRRAAPAATNRRTTMTEDQIKHMVDRFLGWRLPENFAPDGGVSFKRFGNEGTPHQFRNEPTGTCLLDADQAKAMVRHMIEGLPEPPQ